MVGLEEPSSNAHNDDGHNEGTERTVRVLEDAGDSRDDEKDVTD